MKLLRSGVWPRIAMFCFPQSNRVSIIFIRMCRLRITCVFLNSEILYKIGSSLEYNVFGAIFYKIICHRLVSEMRRPIFKVTLYETSQIWSICHFIYKEFFFWFLLSKQNAWSTIQGIIIHRIPEPWVLCEPLCRKTALTIAEVSGRKRNDYWRNTVLFLFR